MWKTTIINTTQPDFRFGLLFCQEFFFVFVLKVRESPRRTKRRSRFLRSLKISGKKREGVELVVRTIVRKNLGTYFQQKQVTHGPPGERPPIAAPGFGVYLIWTHLGVLV